MARRPTSPQDKKRLSLAKDRRNTYGENAKAARKLIPLRKAKARRAVRRRGNAALDTILELPEAAADAVESTLTTPALQKGSWRKVPDTALGDVVAGKLHRRATSAGARRQRKAKRTNPSD